MTGGWGSNFLSPVSSTEIYPAISGCSLPALPSKRYAHTTFATTGPSSKVVTCGGWIAGSLTASCLLLDLDNQLWDWNTIGQLPQSRCSHAVVSMEDIGTYLIGGSSSHMRRTTDFLAQGSTQWVAGPAIPVDMTTPCAVKISDLSFLVIHNTDIREYQVDITDPTSNSGWQSSTKWPRLQTSRTSRPGCSKIENYIVIAGGWGSGTLRSTEVLNLSTRTIVYAGDMNSPRGWFHMATITRNGQQLILAFGGYSGSSNLNSVEMFNPSNNTWTLAPTTMQGAKSSFGAVPLTRAMICTT